MCVIVFVCYKPPPPPPTETWTCRGQAGGESKVSPPAPCALVPSHRRGKGNRGEVSWRIRVGLLVLPEEMEACSVLPLRTSHTNFGCRNSVPRMQRWVALTRVIATLLFMYPQVHAYGSFHFCARRWEHHHVLAPGPDMARPRLTGGDISPLHNPSPGTYIDHNDFQLKI